MHDALTRLGASGDRWLDGAVAAAIAAACTVGFVVDAPRPTALAIGSAAATAVGCAAVASRRRHPLVATVGVGVALSVPGLWIGGRWSNALPDALVLVPLILAYTIGREADGTAAALGLLAVVVAASGGTLADPVSDLVFTVPAWLAGRTMRSRHVLAAALAARAEELEREREAFAREAVRYERARIARDLHDVVAHSLSMIVVQAGAGRRALAADPDTATDSLRHIADGARQAGREIHQLAEILGESEPERGGSLRLLDQLVRRAAANGLSVEYRFQGSDGELDPALARAAYHVAQEGITNALKHAPGAAITVDVRAGADGLAVVVENGMDGGVPSGLERVGGSYGIHGLRDRVRAVGGQLQAGPTAAGGWRLAAQLPASPEATASS